MHRITVRLEKQRRRCLYIKSLTTPTPFPPSHILTYSADALSLTLLYTQMITSISNGYDDTQLLASAPTPSPHPARQSETQESTVVPSSLPYASIPKSYSVSMCKGTRAGGGILLFI